MNPILAFSFKLTNTYGIIVHLNIKKVKAPLGVSGGFILNVSVKDSEIRVGIFENFIIDMKEVF
ncbi:hypothetical protein LX24_00783 [Desulfallas thermosapovorans DSM 6562]|uniref:Uncharacterized protein n=1 Tax=Desulfallas thermosapovorans DSM 6562 TaxID=1121431 RepID=A0A5S4ZVI9_9FIRM|nr:hypothetical protein LX24_00783 [Desulfallas thermosapovorans DSM 6562]